MTMDRRFKSAFRTQRILVLLTDLGLDKCRDSKLSSLSGGERRRVSLAVQVIDKKIIYNFRSLKNVLSKFVIFVIYHFSYIHL